MEKIKNIMQFKTIAQLAICLVLVSMVLSACGQRKPLITPEDAVKDSHAY